MSSASTASFISFSYLDAFCFSCLIVLARTSDTVLTRDGTSWHPCLFPDLRGKLQLVTVKYDTSYRFFLDSLY